MAYRRTGYSPLFVHREVSPSLEDLKVLLRMRFTGEGILFEILYGRGLLRRGLATLHASERRVRARFLGLVAIPACTVGLVHVRQVGIVLFAVLPDLLAGGVF